MHKQIEITPTFYCNYQVAIILQLSTFKTSILNANNRPNYFYGVVLNGLLLAPAPTLPFVFENLKTSEYIWNWVFEPINVPEQGAVFVGLDCASAHTQGRRVIIITAISFNTLKK